MNEIAERVQPMTEDAVTWSRPVVIVEARRLSLRVNFSWTFVGNVIYAGCQWGMLVVLAKLGTLQMVGTFALGLAVTAPIFMFTNLNLRAIQATDARGEFPFSTYLGLRIAATTLALLVVAMASIASGNRGEVLAVVLIVGMAKASESLSDIIFGALQQHERMDRIALSMIFKGVLSLIALSLGILLTGKLLWASLAWAVVWLTVLVRYDIPNGERVVSTAAVRPDWKWQPVKKLVWQAMPLGFVMLAISLNTNIPRYVIENRFSTRDLGIFAAMAYLMVAGNTVVSALGQSASPRLAQFAAAGEWKPFQALMRILLAIGAALGCAGILVAAVFGRQILTLLYRPEYAEHKDVFVWLMAAAALFYVASFLGVTMTALRYFRVQAPLFLGISLATVAASVVLIPRYGMLGAAWTVCITTFLQLVGSAGIVWYALRQGYREVHA